MSNFLKFFIRTSVVMGLLFAHLQPAQAEIDFLQKYERGKILLRRGLYLDAMRELFLAARKTQKGHRHFGAHYYLAVAYYRIGDITRAIKTLNEASKLIKNRRQRQVYNSQMAQIKALFGKLHIVLEVDPEEVGRLKIKIITKTPFSHAQKRRTYRILSKRWLKKGISLSNTTYYLPKGDYSITVAVPQCLQLAFTIGATVMKDITINDQETTLALRAQKSCDCPGGQVAKKIGKKLTCICPKKTVWSTKRQMCILTKMVDTRPWLARNWPWLLGVGVGVVAAGAATLIAISIAQNADWALIIHGKEQSDFPAIY